MDFSLIFDGDPTWLPTLKPSTTLSINFVHFSSYQEVYEYIQGGVNGAFYLKIFESLNENSLLFQPTVKTESIILISGDPKFCDGYHTDPSFSRIDLSNRHLRNRKILKANGWKTLSHQMVGGCTSFSSLFKFRNCNSTILTQPIRRRLRHYVDHNIRSSNKPITNYLTADDILPISQLDSWIKLPSQFSATGFGYRQLSHKELYDIFGYPIKHYINTLCSFMHLPPFPILSTIMDALPIGGQTRTHQKILILPMAIPDRPKVYLPSIRRWLPNDWLKVDSTSSAVKSDDAQPNLAVWDLRILPLFKSATPRHLNTIRCWSMKWWKRHFVSQGLKVFSTLQATGGRGKGLNKNPNADPYGCNLDAIRQAISAAMDTDTMTWHSGSSLFFWRWSTTLQQFAVCGFKPYILGTLPTSKRKARPIKQTFKAILAKKIGKYIQRGYLKIVPSSIIENFIDYFAVPKGEDDVRIVFNGSSCGLNAQLWAPSFWLPTSVSMLRASYFNSKYVDLDLGEMFLNFPIHHSLKLYSGVDLSPIKFELTKSYPEIARELPQNCTRPSAIWTRTWMGLRPSPEWAVRFYYLAEEFIRGNRKEKSNPLRWDSIILNLIGSESYNPSLPNIIKWDNINRRPAGDLLGYVDDLRAIGCTTEQAWAIARRVASRLQYLGIQDAPRKRRVDNGPWAGTIFTCTCESVGKSVTQAKWDKAKGYIDDIHASIVSSSDPVFDFKHLERVRGFLCHLSMTYTIFAPYLKGFHMILTQHLPKRNTEGWKLTENEWMDYVSHKLHAGSWTQEQYDQHMIDSKRLYRYADHPSSVKPNLRFNQSINALKQFLLPAQPPIISDRCSKVSMIIYGFADASGTGFGSTFDDGTTTKYRVGTWGKDSELESSNWRELTNIVDTLEKEALSQDLHGSIMIMATDNATAESCFYKGNSSSEKLFELVVRLRKLELQHQFKLYVTHVSGKRMISQGTDGISRGQLNAGVGLGDLMLQYCPWNLSAIDRAPTLKNWITTALDHELEFLTPEDWFEKGHDVRGGYYDRQKFWRVKTRQGSYVWSPPPAAADVAIEQVRLARIKRRVSTHLIVVPRLFIHIWMKQLYKVSDLVVEIPAGSPGWQLTMLEPLVLGFVFPFLYCRPFELKGTPKMLQMGRKVRTMFKTNPMASCHILSELWAIPKQIPHMSEELVSRMLFFTPKRSIPYERDGSNRPWKKSRQG